MPNTDILKTTTERLKKYQLFSSETIKAVARVAEDQAAHQTYQDFFKKTGVTEPFIFKANKRSGVPVVDVPAKTDQPVGAIVVHLPMANPLDPNQLFQIATIAAVNPEYRVIGFGNPSGKPYKFKEQGLTFWRRFAIANTKHKAALVEAELQYLASQKLHTVIHAGYSYGAHKALIATQHAEEGSVNGLILVDPVAHPRGIRQLLNDFNATFGPLGEYVNRTKIGIYLQARKDSKQTGWKYGAYARPVNIAIGFMLSRLDSLQLLRHVMGENPTVRASVAWGTKSELGNDNRMVASMDTFTAEMPGRVRQFRLVGDAHALANDIHLHAAIIREALTP